MSAIACHSSAGSCRNRGVAGGEEGLVIHLAQGLAALVQGIVDIDHDGPVADLAERGADGRRRFPIRDQQRAPPCSRMKAIEGASRR